MPPVLRHYLPMALAIIVTIWLTRQVRKPSWGAGRPFLWLMNASHSNVTDWGLQHVTIGTSFNILDVGCGGGRTIGKLAAMASDGHVSGVDYSNESVTTARRTNAHLISAGRADVQQASVSTLPFPDGTFDVVTAVETHYYWPSIESDLREVRRVLKPGGRLVLIAEAYRGRSFDLQYRLAMSLLSARYLSVDEHRQLLAAAGFAAIEIFENQKKGWLTAIGQRTF